MKFKVKQNASNAPGKNEVGLISYCFVETRVRVFEDKLLSNPDKNVFCDFLDKVTIEKLKDALDVTEEYVLTDLLFCDFQRSDEYDAYGELVREAPFIYEACTSVEAVRKIANERMAKYIEAFPSKKKGLVIFDDALRHILRICRIINSKRGSALLVEVGGSGK